METHRCQARIGSQIARFRGDHRPGCAGFSQPRPARQAGNHARPSRWRRSAICRSPIRPASRCRWKAIAEDPEHAFDYTARGNMVAVISNGTAILGLGNLGALASKPVMEGKAVLFKRFADVDSIDLEVDTEDVDEFINCVRYLGPSFGGINLEDIKAPDCFIIESRCARDGHPGLP
jgi:malate dehydrogenase (oxaloacetate-decarboxylating)(NADP+)